MHTRRIFLKNTAIAAAGAGVVTAAPAGGNFSVGVVGAGLAGLACADELQRAGLIASVYEASDHAGGRCSSLSFYGQIVERGGELIDTGHKTMIDYARAFGLTLESYIKPPGDIFYNFGGRFYSQAQIVDEIRALVPAMHADLRRMSKAPTAAAHTAADVALDYLSLDEYLTLRGASPLAHSAIAQSYVGEYGREIGQQSCLNFLLYMRADRRSRFQPFGSSDQRYHVVEGNQQVPIGLAQRLASPVQYGRQLTRVSKTAAGSIRLQFTAGPDAVHDAVVLAIPFTVLRGIVLDASLSLPGWKIDAINSLGYGTNAKLMVGFAGRPWLTAGSNGSCYADLPHIQNTWETDPSRATPTRAVITNFTGGSLGAALNPADPQGEAAAFLADLEVLYPGAQAAANSAKAGGQYRVDLEHWPSHPLALGSYTCYLPGQFTGIAGNEATPVGNLFFAGEHTDSFYDYQGFMEGALRSGIAAAQAILKPKH